MLEALLPTPEPHISVAQRRIPVTVGGQTFDPLQIEFPSVEEIASVRRLAREHVSFKRIRRQAAPAFHAAFFEEAEKQVRKQGSYETSPGFHARLADLYALAGRDEDAQNFNRVASKLSKDGIYGLRVVSDLVNHDRLDAADDLINEIELDESERLVRRAAIALLRKNIEIAQDLSTRALQADSADDRAHYLLGITCLVQSKCVDAVRHFKVAMLGFPNSSSLQLNLAISYVCLDQDEKALHALRRAVSIDPINETAVTVLADLAFHKGRAALAIPALKTYLKYDQDKAELWARLARAQLVRNELTDAFEALKHECAVRETSMSWNNLGVVATRLKKDSFGGQCFLRATQLVQEATDVDKWVTPNGNLISWLTAHGHYDDALRIVSSALARDFKREAYAANDHADLYLNVLLTLSRANKWDEMSRLASSIAEDEEASTRLRVGALCDLIYQQLIIAGNREAAAKSAQLGITLLTSLGNKDEQDLMMLINNTVFALLEIGNVDQAKTMLGKLSKYVHKHPFPTATLGLYHLRAGNKERGEALYREAAALAPDKEVKAKIIQKLHLELGRFFAKSQPRLAIKFFTKARDTKNGVTPFSNDARLALEHLHLVN